ncbi:MAG: molybdate ABC transporter permease subunit [Alphaproteobacteria bacterium]
MDYIALWVSLKLAAITSILLLSICIPLGWWLSHTKSVFKIILDPLFSLPIILPPTVLGFYLLLLMNRESFLGKIWFFLTNERLTFTFSGLVVGSIFYSFPFVLKPIQSGFENIDRKLIEVAFTLQCSPIKRLFKVELPLIRNVILIAVLLGFAHTLSEFGVILMIGGNIPESTRTISIAIYDAVDRLDYDQAHSLSLFMLLFSYTTILLVSLLSKRSFCGKKREV